MQPDSGPASETTRTLIAHALVAFVAACTIVGLVGTGGNPIVAVLPPIACAFAYALWKLPLRWSASTLVFLLLGLDTSSDAAGIWSSPLVHLGDALHAGPAKYLGVPIAGFEVVLALLLGVAVIRRTGGKAAEVAQAVGTARLMRDALLLFVAGLLFSIAVSLANGHGVAVWKVRYLAHVVLFFFFFQIALQRPADYRAIGIAVVAAAHLKALFAAYVQLVAAPSLTGGRLAYATNHGDSILFAVAALIVLFPVLERGLKRDVARALLFLPLPVWGMFLNNRRLVWAILAMAMAIVFVATSWRPWKRRVVRACILGAPLLVAYVSIGWNNTDMGGIFRPVAKIRTMMDSTVDRSTLWREKETWNIAYSIRESPMIGVGLGGQYTEYIYLDDISSMYKEYREWPHNTVLGLLLLTGLPGFFATWLPYVLTVFLALRSERLATTSEQRIAASVSIGAIVACMAVAWGDTGAHFLQYKLAAGLAMALVGKLAVETGAWPSTSRSSTP